MAKQVLKIFTALNSLPGTLVADSIYYVLNVTTKKAVQYVTSSGPVVEAFPVLAAEKPYDVYNTTVGSNGDWSVSWANEWHSIDRVLAMAWHNTENVAEMKWAVGSTHNLNGANGNVIESNTITTLLLGQGEGIEISEAGVSVEIIVFGVKK